MFVCLNGLRTADVLPGVQEDASAEQLGHMLAFASSCAVRAVPRKKKEKRKMRHEALVKKIEAGKIVKKKHHKKKAHVPKALDMRNLMDALPTMVERKAAKAGCDAVSLSGAPSSSQPSRDLGGAGDASLLRWRHMGDGSVAQLYAERRRQARANLAQQSAPTVGEKRKREEFH
ncbi:hypothetical protein HPB50_028473 [Hyalomma asiaticum]|nr:hypothetical protein HPB50_028473 [Hyalomma asiaticum]